MAAKPDPLSEVRREAFRDYCRRKGWQNDNGTWAVTAISKAIGKPTNKVSDLLNGKGSFGATIARDIEGSVTDLAPHELDGVTRESKPDTGPFVEVPRAGVKFSNGHGQVVYHDDGMPPLSFRADFLRKIGITKDNAVIVDATGHSNEPKIVDGAVVLVDRGERTKLAGDFYAFRADGHLLIKRLEQLPGIGIIATAENSDFKPKMKVYREGIDDFEVIGRARWMGTLL